MSTEMAVARAEPRLTLWRDPAFVVFWSAFMAGNAVLLVLLAVTPGYGWALRPGRGDRPSVLSRQPEPRNEEERP